MPIGIVGLRLLVGVHHHDEAERRRRLQTATRAASISGGARTSKPSRRRRPRVSTTASTIAAMASEPDDPAPERADRAVEAAAEQLEGLVERRDRLAVVDLVGGVAKEQQAAERDDEGRDAGIGDERALHSADQRRRPRASRGRRPTRSRRRRSASTAVCSRAPKTPMKPICEPTERSICRDTMTSTMPRGHDADDRDLQRQIEEVAGGEEDAAGQRRRSRARSRAGRPAWRAAGRRARRPCANVRLHRTAPSMRTRQRRPCLGRAASLAGGRRVLRHALAELVLGDPLGVDHEVEVVARDGDRASAGSPAGRCRSGVLKVAPSPLHGLAVGELDRRLAPAASPSPRRSSRP